MSIFSALILFFVIIRVLSSASKIKKANNDVRYLKTVDQYQKNLSNTQNVNRTTASSKNTRTTATGMKQTGGTQKAAKPKKESADIDTGRSTTEYLQEKAWQDQIEHAKEKAEEMKRLDKKYGGQIVGRRYLLGDPVPRGMRIFRCPYCAAENLVEASYYSGKDCYFCRTQLK